jgi:murein peptide amidase A
MLLSTVFLLVFSFPALAEVMCLSVNGTAIDHHDFVARDTGLKKRVLVIGQIHGDEPESGELARFWIERLNKIRFPSNHWRIIPLANPDGATLKTRMNAHGVDLNRNFPTKDWSESALESWKVKQKSDPRRFPGHAGGSEPEVKCLVDHILNFQPDIIVSIHTPYGLFDFDGPIAAPISQLLPWRRLGTYPGSLGRWAWDERKIPVLTIELLPKSIENNKSHFSSLQDKITDLILTAP